MKILKNKDFNNNLKCIYEILNQIDYKVTSHERHWISKFAEFEVYIPSKKEQQKIGSFLDKLDYLIDLHQQRLMLLKKYKTGLLQQMFI